MSVVIQDLEKFYSLQAKKYYQTRKKYRSAGEKILEQIYSLQLETPKILELGCGGGRFLDLMEKDYSGAWDYVGVDLSKGLIDLAQQLHPEKTLIHAEMNEYLASLPQESFDMIVGFASVQHLTSLKARKTLMENAYRVLKYGGKLLLINWSLSHRFIRKYPQVLFQSFWKRFKSLGKEDWRDVLIPWKDGEQIHQRYYHLFSLAELRQLSALSGFIQRELFYIDKASQKVAHWSKSANSRYVGEKGVLR